jgi:hypothetical protein
LGAAIFGLDVRDKDIDVEDKEIFVRQREESLKATECVRFLLIQCAVLRKDQNPTLIYTYSSLLSPLSSYFCPALAKAVSP